MRKLIGGALLGALLLLSCGGGADFKCTRYEDPNRPGVWVVVPSCYECHDSRDDLARPMHFDCETDMECETRYGGEY